MPILYGAFAFASLGEWPKYAKEEMYAALARHGCDGGHHAPHVDAAGVVQLVCEWSGAVATDCRKMLVDGRRLACFSERMAVGFRIFFTNG